MRGDLEEDPEIEDNEEEEEEDDYVNEEAEQLQDAEPAQHNAAAAHMMGIQIAADIHCQDDGDEDMEDSDDKQLLIP